METGVVPQQGDSLLHPLSNPGAAGLCPEMSEVAEEASRAGDFNSAVEIYSSQLADLQHPDRGLCLRKGDLLARAGRISEALEAYCTAANSGKSRPDESPVSVETIARALRGKESGLPVPPNPQDGAQDDGERAEDGTPDLFSCRLCKCSLHEPATLECGHTFCKRCIEDDSVEDCINCKQKLSKSERRVDVVLSGSSDKSFESESKARKMWIEGEVLWSKQNSAEALERYNAAVDSVPSSGRSSCQRVESHMEMRNFNQAVQDANSVCRLKPLWTKAHCSKATASSKSDRNDEALQEYSSCLALKPDWTKVKSEAQKVLSEVFSSVFENEDVPTPPHPSQGGSATRSIKPPASLQSSRPSTQKPGCSPQDSEFSVAKSSASSELPPTSPTAGEGNSKSSGDILASSPAPHGGLKRKHSSDGALAPFIPPSKSSKPDDVSAVQTASVGAGRSVAADLSDSGDSECSLCMRLFYEPVATPCGHTFCLKCSERCLDHNPNCPLCKENLSEYLATRGYSKTVSIEEVSQRYLGDESVERKKIHEEEMNESSNLNQEVPIFVCTMAFPTIPCPLHVFEPRYRLMIRRSMETGTKQFGMCIADESKGFADYGCMSQVRDVKFFPDGRSVVDTIGVSRFRVISHGQRDGYHTAKIEYSEDRKVDGEESAESSKSHDSVYEQANNWFTSSKDNMKSQILSHFGHFPSKDPDPQAIPDGPAWCWWSLAVLPSENRAQLTISAMNSLKDRLIAIRRVLIFVTRKRPR